VPDQLKEALTQFVGFARSLRSDEKSEAQTFLDHFFRSLGHAGVVEAGATFEFRVAKKPGSAQLELIKGSAARAKGGKKFADLLWPDSVLIEMKGRGENLENTTTSFSITLREPGFCSSGNPRRIPLLDGKTDRKQFHVVTGSDWRQLGSLCSVDRIHGNMWSEIHFPWLS
jgi:hypothetical protein